MDQIKVLVEGYARENEDETWNASSSSVLLESNGIKVLSDPGANEKALLQALKKENLTVDGIDIVFLSHYHPDHILNIRLFPKHKIYDGDTIYEGDFESFFEERLPGTDIEIIETPGHAYEQVSLALKIQNENYVVAQDIFWWTEGKQKSNTVEDLLNLEDPFVKNKEILRESRQKILKVADWIIPGHGKMFRNPKR